MDQRTARGTLGALALTLLAAPAALAQGSEGELRGEIEALRKGQQEIRKELQDIKKLLQQQARPQRAAGPNVKGVALSLSNDAIKGEESAKVTLVEFLDYQ